MPLSWHFAFYLVGTRKDSCTSGELEELEDIKLYDQAKKDDNGERILFSDYLKNRKTKNA